MKYIMILLLTIAGMLFLVAFTMWTDGRDRDLHQAMAEYERCVQREYRMTPTRWYEENGKYPECQTLKP